MIPSWNDGILSFTFDLFSDHPIQAQVITRNGGVSPSPWSSLNLGGTVGDDQEHVFENKRRVIKAFNLAPDKIFDVWQVHSADWVYSKKSRPVDQPHVKADIIISDEPGLALFMRFADCVPIFIYDPFRHAIGIAHAGWQGTAKNVARNLVHAMQTRFNSKPSELLAAIGPAICMKHYPVGHEVGEAIQESIGNQIEGASSMEDGNLNIDLKKCNEIQLLSAGVHQVENSEICTVCDNENWFSHRAENGKTGRFGAFIKLIDANEK
jgi:YfiH family protein